MQYEGISIDASDSKLYKILLDTINYITKYLRFSPDETIYGMFLTIFVSLGQILQVLSAKT